MAISPGPAGLKFWRAPGLSADNTADINNLPAGAVNWFNPWGPKRSVQDWVRGAAPQFMPAATDITNLPAGGANWFNPWGPRQLQRTWTQGGIQLVPVTLTAASGSYTLTGTAIALAFGQVAGSGSYSVSGSSVALALGHVAGAGNYSLTGTAAGLTVAVNYAAAAGSYTSTGSSVTFAFGQGAAAGAYTLTGASAAFVIPGVVTYLPAGMTGGYVPWGRPPRQDWFWSVAYTTTGAVTLSAGAGSYTLSGSAAALTATDFQYIFRQPLITRIWPRPPRQDWIWSVAYLVRTTLTAGAGSYILTGADAQFVQTGTIVLVCGAGSYTLTGSDVSVLGVTPPEVTPPPTGGAGAGVRVGRYGQLKLRKKLKRNECEELLEYLRSLPPAERQEEIEQLASRPWIASLLEMMPAAAPMQISAKPADDDDDDECIALLLQILNS